MTPAFAGAQIRLKVLRESRDAEGNIMDEVGEEFWLSLVRGPVDKNADRASRRAPVSLTIVFAHERERERERERETFIDNQIDD